MMRLLLYIGVLFSAIACGQKDFRLQTGDLLFQVADSSPMTGAITAATGDGKESDFSHVGIAVASEGADSVLEATTDGGVRMTALAEFLDRRVVVMRLRDTTGVTAAVARARRFRGQPYDYSYLPDNGKLYCSELIWESYLSPDGSRRFSAKPMNFRAADGTMPDFWTELFTRQGEPIPQGVPGTNPNDLSKDPALVFVHRFDRDE